MKHKFVLLLAALTFSATARADSGQWFTMQVEIDGRQIEGRPLAWSNNQVYLLARDGRLWDFAPNRTNKFRKTSGTFSSYSAPELRGQLEREFGPKLTVTSTGHYLVAHPKGKEAWAARFEDLYRSIINYFSLRNLPVRSPDFPLVAVVWPTREDYVRYSASQGSPVGPNVLGYYSPTTNRVTLYDLGSQAAGWQQNEATIIHEATHQVAFNTGLHNRFASTPRWLAEGLGTMFEAPGVWNWRNYPSVADRVNRLRLAEFRQLKARGRQSGVFANLLGSDRMFETDPSAAYAEAWAWVFFLTETHSQKFGQYVARVAAQENFTAYPLAKRMNDFTAIFGQDLRTLERHFLNFIDELPVR